MHQILPTIVNTAISSKTPYCIAAHSEEVRPGVNAPPGLMLTIRSRNIAQEVTACFVDSAIMFSNNIILSPKYSPCFSRYITETFAKYIQLESYLESKMIVHLKIIVHAPYRGVGRCAIAVMDGVSYQGIATLLELKRGIHETLFESRCTKTHSEEVAGRLGSAHSTASQPVAKRLYKYITSLAD